MRKNALLQRKEGLAAKMDEILGELKTGPQRFRFDTPADPGDVRSRTLGSLPSSQDQKVRQTSRDMIKGCRMESIEIPLRQAATPIMKTKRAKEVSEAHYVKSRDVDQTLDHYVEYEIDSRRLGPRLLKVIEIQKKLDAARAKYGQFRERARALRTQQEALQADAADKLEERLNMEMLDYGSHVPTSLPLEFSKFSGKVLDSRVREQKSAVIRKYDDAAALRGEAVKREKEELEVLSERFGKSFKLQRQHVLSKQVQKREGFSTLWKRKQETKERALAREMAELRKAVENYERELAEAQKCENTELGRIRNNERVSALPMLSRAASSQHRF
jgi:hypothetical protein